MIGNFDIEASQLICNWKCSVGFAVLTALSTSLMQSTEEKRFGGAIPLKLISLASDIVMAGFLRIPEVGDLNPSANVYLTLIRLRSDARFINS
jgi:hypothetical protein